MKILLLILLISFSAKAQDTTSVKLIVVEWEDIVSTDSGWHTLQEAKDFVETENGIVTQVGFLLRKDEKYLIMTESYFKRGTVGVVIRIPIGVVRRIEEVDVKF